MKKIDIKIIYIVAISLIAVIAVVALTTYFIDKKNNVRTPPAFTTTDESSKVMDPDDEALEDKEEYPNVGLTTSPSDTLEGTDDWGHAQTWEKIYQEYPWYKEFPVEKSGYRIVWDPKALSFRIRLKISETTSEEIKNTITEMALDEIEKITGNPRGQYPYYVLYTD